MSTIHLLFGKGTITKLEFEQIYKNYFPFGDAKKYAQYVFKHLDGKKDGVLDFDEFMTGIDKSTKANLEEKLKCISLF